MIRSAPDLVHNVRQLAHVALAMLTPKVDPAHAIRRHPETGAEASWPRVDHADATDGKPGTAAGEVRSGVSIGDWDELFVAVEASLRQLAARRVAAVSGFPSEDAAGRIEADMRECMVALDQLHTTLADLLASHRHLEQEVVEAQAALAQARIDLAGTRAGEIRARHLASHDSLTSLPNRRLFREQLDRALTDAAGRRRALAVLYLDLDGFKLINDAYGHDAGDELLTIVAARLSRAVRAEDMVGRLGGDEFACLLTDVATREQVGKLARKLFDAVVAPVKIGRAKLHVRASIGISMCTGDGMTSEALLKQADAAMYLAKRQKTGHEFFEEGIAASTDAQTASGAVFWNPVLDAAKKLQLLR